MGMSNLSPSSFEDSESLSWDFSLSELNVADVHTDDTKIITAMVRSSYLKHLERSLRNNYEKWNSSNEESGDFKFGLDDIRNCANFLEHKAVRACMMTSYYQRAMVQAMKEIKKSTEDGSLFFPLIDQLFEKKKKKKIESKEKCLLNKEICVVNKEIGVVNKEIQTDDMVYSNKIVQTDEMICSDKTVQTNISLSNSLNDSFSESNLPNVEESIAKESFCADEQHFFSDNDNMMNENHIILEDPCKKYGDIEDLFNILMYSPNVPENHCNNSNFSSPKKRKYEEIIFENHKLPNDFKTNVTVIEPEQEPPDDFFERGERQLKLDDRIKKLAALFGEDDSEGSKTEPVETNGAVSPTAPATSSINENSPPFTENTLMQVPIDWRSEFAAQSCHLKVLLSRYKSCKRQRLHKRFKELFGVERLGTMDITVNEAALCRKRTANLVVAELTPHYINGQISSRDIFKSLAKKITDDMLDLSSAADPDVVTDEVKSYFENGKCINSLKDFLR